MIYTTENSDCSYKISYTKLPLSTVINEKFNVPFEVHKDLSNRNEIISFLLEFLPKQSRVFEIIKSQIYEGELYYVRTYYDYSSDINALKTNHFLGIGKYDRDELEHKCSFVRIGQPSLKKVLNDFRIGSQDLKMLERLLAHLSGTVFFNDPENTPVILDHQSLKRKCIYKLKDLEALVLHHSYDNKFLCLFPDGELQIFSGEDGKINFVLKEHLTTINLSLEEVITQLITASNLGLENPIFYQ
ncbi:hypothetical protein GYB22_08195 [bacterium]|nr:hypothetical protein [bacterium]